MTNTIANTMANTSASTITNASAVASGTTSISSTPPQRKPSILKRIFKRSPKKKEFLRKNSTEDWNSTSTFTPVTSRKGEVLESHNKLTTEASNLTGPIGNNDFGSLDDKTFDEHSEGELDLHDIMSDEDADVLSRQSLDEKNLSLLRDSQNMDINSLLANLTAEDLSFPKYIKATRKNNKSPKVFNNLFLAQELRCSDQIATPLDDAVSHLDHDFDDDIKDGAGQRDDAKVPMNPHETLVMAFSRDGKYLAVAGRDSRITVWQVISSPLSRLKFKNFETTRGDDWSRKSRSKAFHGAPVFLQEPVRVFEGHTKSVLCLDWSKNNFLLSGSMDKTVKLWNIERPECLETFQHGDFVTALRFHPTDDRFFISGALDNQLRLWSILEHSVAYTNDLGDNALITALEFTPFGNYCMVGGFNGSLFALETQGLQLVKRIELTRKLKSPSGSSTQYTTVSGIKIFENPTCTELPNSDLSKWNLLITTNDSTVRLVDLSLRKLVTRFKGNSNQSSSIVATLSEDNRYIISGSEDHWCYVWENNNAIINNKLRSSMKEILLDSRNQLDEKHKKISKLLHDNRLWKKLPVKMFLEDENGKKYIANNNTSYSSFHAHNSRVNVALFAPEKSKRLLKFSDDKIFDLVKRGTLLAESRGSEFDSEKTWGSDHIIVTSDVSGLVRVFRQDPAFYIRKNFLELKKLQKRDRSRHSYDPTQSPDLGSYAFSLSSKNEMASRARSKSPTHESSTGIRNMLHQKMRSPYSRTNSTSSARAARSNSDLSKHA